MILSKKTCELSDVDSLIEQLYLQTKQAYFKAQTSDIKENMSPKDKDLQKISQTSLDKTRTVSKCEAVNISDPRDSSTNYKDSTGDKNSVPCNDNFNIRTTSSSFEKSLNNEISDFEALTQDISIRRNSSSNCEIATTKADFDSRLDALKLEYSKIESLSLNCDSAIAFHRKSGNETTCSDSKMISCKSKVVVQVLPPIEFGNKFDLLKSGISNSSLGFKPYTFSPIRTMSSLIHQINNTESLSEEECVQNVEFETSGKRETSVDESILWKSKGKRRKMIEESNSSFSDKNMSPANYTDIVIKEECIEDIESGTNSKNVISEEKLVLLDSNGKKRKIIEESNFSNGTNMSPETNHADTLITKYLNVNRGNILAYKNNGVKLCDIEYIAPKLAVASIAVIRTLHYILYGSYGLTRNEILMCQTVENILQFNGFPFYEESEIFRKKRSLLVNLPSVLYVRIYNILMNYTPRQKHTSLEKLLNFLKHPSDNSHEGEITEEDMFYEELKKKALQARPFVKIQKLDEAFVKLHQKNLEDLETTSRKLSSKNKSVPQPKQLSLQLKAIPGVAENILRARRRIINLLHSLLYGRPGSEDINRKNILEFSGFKSHHKNFLPRRLAFLYRLKMKEIEQLCDVVTLPAQSGNKNMKIKKLLKFFSFLRPHQKKSTTNKFTDDKPKIKLRDFEKIYTNVECSTPEDLTALNDLLYVKPCDSSEIHQKILDFSSFAFDITSFDFQYRKTLMHYMNPKTVKEIARILEIEDWESCINLSELSLRILKFLMDIKLPDKKKSRADQKHKREKTHPHILKFHSSKAERRYCKSRSCTPETFDSTYASEEVNDIECDEHTFTCIYCRRNTSNSRLHCHHKGLSDRHTQILNDSVPLLDLMQHPTDKELLSQINKIINNSSLSLTVGELVKEVLNNYPNFDLHYRIDFIKAKTLEVVQELRLNANVFPD